ncbi:hydroxymethylglutaryl-CoA lyase [Marinicella sp. S1101]|uniref:hydroxymethylglutaryl-CoA lyase n=1 Tax=Marinicella marina TaxID=2996016 RepID=UPI00226085F4|nr:hydroxymethylglutaryl-CoA lyase [Marinicella marina]MCX7555011.1 hydroxymethylglutaryl-CoA lyase [Marinicella marina]MDJ1141325.1 hydroxymethylglutaryl-CoA lyase [Marinicella marina]
MNYPTRVKIVEVSPRDGLQNEKQVIDVSDKLQLINDLQLAGVKHIEVAGFVSPKWVPQLDDAKAVCAGLVKEEGVHHSALTPNLKGLDAAIEAGIEEVAVFTAASETFNQKNINCSIAESFERFAPVMEKAHAHNIKVRGYVSCVLGCPYEGAIDPKVVAEVTHKLHQMGCFEVSLGDTIGTGTPLNAQKMLGLCADLVPMDQLALHFHDTYGQALANIQACLELGASVVDASVAGIGGCPYAKGATGNVSTENVVYMLNGMGIETGIDLAQLVKAGQRISEVLGRQPNSQVALAIG